MSEDQVKITENSLNELIAKAVKNGGYVYIIDKMQNNFVIRLTEPIKISFYGGYKGASDAE